LGHLQSFAEVQVTDAGVDTVQFCEATDGLIGMFGECSCSILVALS
jgi:hypothetical protein